MISPQVISFAATLAQITVAILRVACFSYAVLLLGRDSANASLLLAVGYLPFIAFFDILVQSFSRISSIRQNNLINTIAPYRLVFSFSSLTVISVVALKVFFDPEISRSFIVLCFILGSLGYLWEGWLAVPSRSLAFAAFEIVLLTSATMGSCLGYFPAAALIVCFISFPVARLAALLMPGLPRPQQSSSASISTSASQYIGLSVAQQAAGATSASLPAIYAQASGVFVGLPAQLAWFRVMHAIGAIASIAINALGSRMFYSQASTELKFIEYIIQIIRIRKISIVVFSYILIISMYFLHVNFLYAIIIYSLLIALENFESSYQINTGNPLATLRIQILVLCLSISALGYINNETFLGISFISVYSAITIKSARI